MERYSWLPSIFAVVWVLTVFSLFHDGLNFIVFVLRVSRVVLGVRHGQDVATLVRVSDIDVLLNLALVEILVEVLLSLSNTTV